MRAILCLGTALIAGSAMAWQDTGHMVIAEIARQTMSPKLVAECEWLLKQDAEPKTNDFLTASCWADDFKTPATAPWHFVNFHFRTDGKATDNKPGEPNVLTALKRFSEVLRDKRRDPRERAEALRHIMHFVGDVHQPMHAVARDSDELPAGDRGGNEFKILPIEKHKQLERPPMNLHALWDMGGNLFGTFPRPLSKDHRAEILRLATSIRARHPQATLSNIANIDPTAWAQESVGLAKDFVYRLKENEAPPADYIKKCEEASAKRVAYAGYRLAAYLKNLMG